MFDLNTFLQTSTTEANSTQLDPVPEGEYTAISQLVDKDCFSTFDYKNGEKAGTKGFALTVKFKIADPKAGEYDGRMVSYRTTIDVTPDGNGLDFGKGKNIGLGRLREALGQNRAGVPWGPSMLGGQVAKIVVKHEMDKQDSTKVYVRVDGVLPA